MSFLAPQRNYKPVSKSELESQTKKVMAARREVEKMGKKIGSYSWPEDISAVRRALLTTTTLDAEVEENEGNSDLIPTFKSLWKELETANGGGDPAGQELVTPSDLSPVKDTGSKLEDVLDLECSGIGDGDGAITETIDGDGAITETIKDAEVYKNVVSDGGVVDESSHSVVVEGSVEDDMDDSDDEVEDSELCTFKQLSIRVENKGWREFQMMLLSEELFDFIFADPVQSLTSQDLKQNIWTEFKDERKIREFATFCLVSLRPGCYVFVIVLAEEFSAFSSAFQAEGMKVMKGPFFVIPKATSFQTTRLKDLPQDCGELAVVAKTPGTSSGFTGKFYLPYSLIESTFKRKIGVMDNVPRYQNPLRGAKSRAEVRPRERHHDFVSEVIETFCSPTGTVLDTFGGASTTVLSCVSLGRPCVAIERDSYFFDLAVRRLEKLCRDRLLHSDSRNSPSSAAEPCGENETSE